VNNQDGARGVAGEGARQARLAKTLNVAGAYHSRLMNSASKSLRELSAPRSLRRASRDLAHIAEPVRGPDQIRLIVTGSVVTVRWSESLEYPSG
jgi:[acyl-carrier-protein] S-malonyltransferase